MKKKIIIIGGGGHAGIILDCIKAQGEYEIIGYSDKAKGNLSKEKVKYMGNLKELSYKLKEKANKKTFLTIAIGENYIRKKIYEYLKKNVSDLKWGTIVHPSASISSRVKIGEGSQILNGSILCYKTVISKHVCINTGAIIDHDNFFDDFSSAGPGACTGGNVKVGKLCFLGINSSVKHNIRINENTVIGANSFVNFNCKANSLYFGTPAKKIKNRKKDDGYL